MLYRWTTSLGLFLGGVTTYFFAREHLLHPLRDRLLIVGVISSLLGIAASLLGLFLHPSNPDKGNLLEHRGAAMVAIGLNLWPWSVVVFG